MYVPQNTVPVYRIYHIISIQITLRELRKIRSRYELKPTKTICATFVVTIAKNENDFIWKSSKETDNSDNNDETSCFHLSKRFQDSRVRSKRTFSEVYVSTISFERYFTTQHLKIKPKGHQRKRKGFVSL